MPATLPGLRRRPGRITSILNWQCHRLKALARPGVAIAGRYSWYEEENVPEHRIFAMAFAKVYPAYVRKAEAKGRTRADVDRIICWLTGYDQAGLERQIALEHDIKTFFAQAPAMNPNTPLITGVVCGVRVENVEDPLMRTIRSLDKLIDELAKGKAMEKILRK